MPTGTGHRPRTSASARPVPECRPEFAHLSLDELRAYRHDLTIEEGRTSYWRRLIQARLDVVRSASVSPDPMAHERLRGLLAQSRGGQRQALVELVGPEPAPPLPDLEELWTMELRPDDPVHTDALLVALGHAELQLSTYRATVHDKLSAATTELIARYRQEPALALTALPLEPPRSRVS
jgi:Arc/MetJ family transcription regulator